MDQRVGDWRRTIMVMIDYYSLSRIQESVMLSYYVTEMPQFSPSNSLVGSFLLMAFDFPILPYYEELLAISPLQSILIFSLSFTIEAQ